MTAAYAFLLAENHGPWIFDRPQTGPDMQAMEERVMRFAQAYPNLFTLAATGDADAQKVMSAAIKGPAPGSGIETRSDEERPLVAQLTGAGKTSAEIQTALDQHRARGRVLTTREQRRTPGIAAMSTPLPSAKAGWLLAGLHNENGVAIPGQVAEKLVGRHYASFDGLRGAIWRLIGQTPELTVGLRDRNLQYLGNGNAPVPPDEQQVTVRRTGELSRHHCLLASICLTRTLRENSSPIHFMNTHPSSMISVERRKGTMTREQILGVVNSICFGRALNSRVTPLLDKLDDALPHSKISDLIYWNKPQLTPEQIVDEAMKREADYIAEHGSEPK